MVRTDNAEIITNIAVDREHPVIEAKFLVIYKHYLMYIVRVIKSRRMRWAGHVARRRRREGCIGSWWGNRREGDQWGDLGLDGWIILGWISGRWDVGI